ncbi:response regulator transcription factor [Treponema sp.]|uniref:response regulator transcription factor n=1 Tax=Treponema sp. TaxID=166 RepID=UPI00298E4EF8|nr:response regulator transcription factor [Treponema sp.]MCQ2241766.1 response regulator transcription factor [Treponema sp.]
MEKILVVEDDDGIAEFEILELEHEGFEIKRAVNGREALEFFESFAPDVILLDVMLPELSGLEVLRRIRKTSSVPVIMVSARGETYDKVNGLDAGADDYIAKPFEIEELLARLRAVIRRSDKANAEGKSYTIGNLVLNTESMEVTNNGVLVELSKTEYLLLKCLMSNLDVVLSRDAIIDKVWGEGHSIDVNAVDVYVRYLRSKLGEGIISTVRGAGYVIRSEQKN